MRTLNGWISTVVMMAVLTLGTAAFANAGIIYSATGEPCTEKVDSGIIYSFTGIIYSLTGIIYSLVDESPKTCS